MLRQTIAGWAAAALVAGPSFASAETHGLASKGELILGADRLFQLITYAAISQGSGASSSSGKTTSLSLFGGIGTGIYNIPRLAFDYAVTDNLTIGGAAFAHFTLSSTTSSGGGPSNDTTKIRLLGVAPRIGYVLPLSSSIWFWPRAGLTYDVLTFSQPTGTSSSLSQFAANVEAMFVFSPVEHVGITLGPAVDVPISGSLSGGPPTDTSQCQVGVTAGLNVWF
jgi:hypothetical protein